MKRLTKKYLIHHPKGLFKVFVSQIDIHLFVGSTVYYLKRDSRPQEGVGIDIECQQFTGQTEKEVYDQSIVWMELNLGDGFKVELLPGNSSN